MSTDQPSPLIRVPPEHHMKTIWKFPLAAVEKQIIYIPRLAQLLTVQVQHGRLHLWALVNPEAPTVPHTILTYGTGNPIPPSDAVYIGSYQALQGHFVGHVFGAEG